MTGRLRAIRRALLKHPYADTVVVICFIILSVGGIHWWNRPTVLLRVDGAVRRLHPQAKTVAEILKQQGIKLGPQDISAPPLNAAVTRNMVVQVTRVTYRSQVRVTAGKPKIVKRVQLKANLRPVLVERGFVQKSRQTVRMTLHDGTAVSERVVKSKTYREPIFRLTLFNRKTGRPEKVYDLAKAPKLLMRATGYYVGEKYVPSDTVFLGYKLRRGFVAVDPKVIPLRTRLYVKGYGYAYAADTGSAIKGKRIDLAVKDKKEEQAFNRHNVEVYILDRTKKW